MTETFNAFTGSGTLTGEPWRWTAWTSTSQVANAAIVVESADGLGEGRAEGDHQADQA